MSDPVSSGEGTGPAPSAEKSSGAGDGGKVPVRGRRFKRLWILALVVATLFALIGVKETSYEQENPAFCSSACHHPREPGGKTHEGHQDVACQKCHTTRLSTGWKLLAESALGGSEHPQKHGKVEASACSACHEARPAEWKLIAQTEGHRGHRAAKNVTCLSCHSFAAHGDGPIENVCRNCHEDQRLHQPETEGAETCLSCHSFALSPERAQKPTTLACESCHAPAGSITKTDDLGDALPMKAVNEHVLHGGVACQLCHEPHGKRPPPLPGKPGCLRCHQIEIFKAGKEVRTAPEGHSNCEQCHKPHEPIQTALDSCRGCHAKNAGALAANAPSTALKHQSCASCHLPHSWRAEPSGCKTCHEDKAQMIQTRSPPEHGSCTNCHEVHGPPPTGAVCVTCHAKTKGSHVALAPERHKDCTACHNPHAPSPKETRTACAKCHVNELAQTMRIGPEAHIRGNGCLTCHKPHDNPRPPASLCGKCHADKSVLVSMAGPASHKACVSCHKPHSFVIKDMASACSSCHSATGAASGSGGAAVLDFANGSHKDTCKNCHLPHGTQSIAKTECFKCHATIEAKFKAPNEKHGVCRSCHEPHQPARNAPARCGTCHAAKVQVATQWPAGSAHAGACNGCHESHSAQKKKACSECHAKEATSASGGKHQCQQCHPPHKAPPGRGSAWWSRCSECHADKTASVRVLGTTHSNCKNCHEPHRFAAPACGSCHTGMAAKGLHASKSHLAECTGCHDPHTKALPTRSKCLTCHSNQQRHQPDAEKCYGCHVFK